jgi:hypothetical protein
MVPLLRLKRIECGTGPGKGNELQDRPCRIPGRRYGFENGTYPFYAVHKKSKRLDANQLWKNRSPTSSRAAEVGLRPGLSLRLRFDCRTGRASDDIAGNDQLHPAILLPARRRVIGCHWLALTVST